MALRRLMAALGLALALGAQQPEPQKPPAPIGDEARAALAEAREVAKRADGVAGPERSRRLEVAASAYDRLVAKFGEQPRAAAVAAWQAAVLWRRHGSPALAEKDYLHAAQRDPARYGQRGLFGAADMQRRLERTEEARATYERAEAVDRRTSYAQRARLWVARLLQREGDLDAAIERFQTALESAPTPRLAIETADHLAKAWIEKGDLDAAGFVLDHARKVAVDEAPEDPIDRARLKRAYERLPAHRALQRARDERDDAGGDAVRLDERRRRERSQERGGK